MNEPNLSIVFKEILEALSGNVAWKSLERESRLLSSEERMFTWCHCVQVLGSNVVACDYHGNGVVQLDESGSICKRYPCACPRWLSVDPSSGDGVIVVEGGRGVAARLEVVNAQLEYRCSLARGIPWSEEYGCGPLSTAILPDGTLLVLEVQASRQCRILQFKKKDGQWSDDPTFPALVLPGKATPGDIAYSFSVNSTTKVLYWCWLNHDTGEWWIGAFSLETLKMLNGTPIPYAVYKMSESVDGSGCILAVTFGERGTVIRLRPQPGYEVFDLVGLVPVETYMFCVNALDDGSLAAGTDKCAMRFVM